MAIPYLFRHFSQPASEAVELKAWQDSKFSTSKPNPFAKCSCGKQPCACLDKQKASKRPMSAKLYPGACPNDPDDSFKVFPLLRNPYIIPQGSAHGLKLVSG